MIVAIGDSFTYGDELPDPSTQAWPALLGKKLNKPVLNLGVPGSGNARITKEIINRVINGEYIELVIACFTSPHRQEHGDEDGVFDIWPGCQSRAFDYHHTHRKQLIKYVSRHNNDHYDYRNYLRQVLLLQTFLKSYNIPYVFLQAYGGEPLYEEYNGKLNNQLLVDNVDANHFMEWPGDAIVKWTWGYDHGPGGHPLAEGQQIIADKIYEHIRNKHRLS